MVRAEKIEYEIECKGCNSMLYFEKEDIGTVVHCENADWDLCYSEDFIECPNCRRRVMIGGCNGIVPFKRYRRKYDGRT